MKTPVTKKERLKKALNAEPVDRIPFALWRYFPEEDKSVDGLVEATIRYVRRWDFDLVKVMIPNRIWTAPWGGSFATYDRDAGFYPSRELLVKDPADWRKIRRFDPRRGPFGEQLEVMRILKQEAGDDMPVLGTVFAPLCVGIELSGDRVHRQMAAGDRNAVQAMSHNYRHTGRLRAGLRGGSPPRRDLLCRAVRTRGRHVAAGVRRPRPAARPSSLRADRRQNLVQYAAPVQAGTLYFDVVKHFPVQAVNWHDRGKSGPSLREARKQFPGLLVGGLDHEGTGALVSGVPEEAAAQAVEAIEQLAGEGLILGPGCCAHLKTPEANIDAVQRAIAARAHERR